MFVRKPLALLFAAATTACCVLPALAQMNPVNLTGFNRDIVVESGAAPPFSAFAQVFDGANNCWYERTLPGSTKGLPAGGSFNSIADPTVRGQFQPYNAANALILDASLPTNSLAFMLADQVGYDAIAVFASSANGGGIGTLIINFTDGGSSSNINFNAQDWFNVTANNALNNLGRANLGTNAIDDASANNPRIYHTSINLVTLGFGNRPISSITFTKPAGSLNTAVFGVSGQRSVSALTPVDATGWTRDIVVENTATPPYGGFAQSFDTFNNIAWYENGLPGSTKGLPAGGAFTSVSNPAIQGQLQSYSSPNALFLDTTAPTGTLNFSPLAQRPYDFLAIFASSSNQGGLGSMVITFTDASTSGFINFNAQDWFGTTTNNALNNLGRLGLNGDTIDDGSAGNPRLYQTIVDLGSLGLSNRAVSSISFTKPNVGTGAQNTVIMAISGQPVPGVTGACLFADGTCGLLPADVCAAGGGLYAGDNTTCPATGACIALNGDCSIRSLANCAFVGGTYLGDGFACPTPGACIASNGDCAQLNSFQCAVQGGTYLGDGQPCPVAGACCMTTGCALLNSFQCAFMGGSFQGAGSTCELSYPSIVSGSAAFEDISSTGTQITVWTGGVDDGNASVPIGFTFQFFGNTYTNAFVGTNGLITFGTGSNVFNNTCLPATGEPNNGAYPLWDDYHLHASHTGRAFYETRTSPNRLIVQWDLVGHYNSGNPPVDQSTFEAVLFENGNIEYRYGVIAPVAGCDNAGGGAAVGIENASGTVGLSYDNTLLGTGNTALAIQATSPCPTCRADFNGDGFGNSQDFFDFISAFFSLQPTADFNRDGNINSQDFFDFLVAFFAGC